ncbi:septal ring lytic transglycosylase RlpA family protein [Azospirillum sp. SYSU D00513]|uniref:septal ring lytic transglycosylase RlpA family protein n=1 Tax=Azospirillum sp. SYSU D00513 TaxID=2812561 RepID=UPI001A95BEDA|nr:septal ring lytic transglycosylase RlpA family protein [Azospirillum sp. SYSU D00513]
MRTILAVFAVLFATFQPSVAQESQSGTVQQQGEASYFRGGQDGNTKTATGEGVDPNGNTAASRDLPLGTEATVTNKETGQSTDVRINDRGPSRDDRVIDLSKKAAEDIGMEKTGTAPVTVEADPAKQKDPRTREALEQLGEKR